MSTDPATSGLPIDDRTIPDVWSVDAEFLNWGPVEIVYESFDKWAKRLHELGYAQ